MPKLATSGAKVWTPTDIECLKTGEVWGLWLMREHHIMPVLYSIEYLKSVNTPEDVHKAVSLILSGLN